MWIVAEGARSIARRRYGGPPLNWIASLPLPLIGLSLFAGLIVMLELGYRAPGRLGRADGEGGGQDLLLSAVFGLLALLLGFTFSLALNRYEGRRELVQREANALGTAWLRADLLEEPARARLKGEIRSYGQVRLAWSETVPAGHSDLATAAAQDRLWGRLREVVRSEPSGELSRSLVESLNEAFDAASARASSRAVTLPGRVLQVLVLYALLSALMLGYVLGEGGRRHRVASMLLLALLALSMTLIMDLDRPLRGAIRVPQAPMETAVAAMR